MSTLPNTAWHAKLVSLVERMLELHKRPAARTPQQEMVKREISPQMGGLIGWSMSYMG